MWVLLNSCTHWIQPNTAVLSHRYGIPRLGKQTNYEWKSSNDLTSESCNTSLKSTVVPNFMDNFCIGLDAHLRVWRVTATRIHVETIRNGDCWACTCCRGTRSLSAADSADPVTNLISSTWDSFTTCTKTKTQSLQMFLQAIQGIILKIIIFLQRLPSWNSLFTCSVETWR